MSLMNQDKSPGLPMWKLTKQEGKVFLYGTLLLGLGLMVAAAVQGKWLLVAAMVPMLALIYLIPLQQERGEKPFIGPLHPALQIPLQILLYGYLLYVVVKNAAARDRMMIGILLATVVAYGVILILRRRKASA